jgi:hypothetical protein
MPAWIHDRADHIRAKNPSMPESEAWAIATQQSHALGKSPKSYGTVKGRAKAKAKYKTPEDDVKKANPEKSKTAFTLDGMMGLGGLTAGYSPGRNVAGETAAAIAPEGRKTRSENIARQAAVVGAPLGGLAALGLAHHYGLTPKVLNMLPYHLSGGSVPEIISMMAPAAIGAGGSMLGGLATGAGTGAIQKLRGPLRKNETKTAMLEGFFDELEKIASEKDSGFLGDLAAGAKKTLTTPIAGTPDLIPHLDKLRAATAGGKAMGQASKGFQAFQASRAAAGH